MQIIWSVKHALISKPKSFHSFLFSTKHDLKLSLFSEYIKCMVVLRKMFYSSMYSRTRTCVFATIFMLQTSFVSERIFMFYLKMEHTFYYKIKYLPTEHWRTPFYFIKSIVVHNGICKTLGICLHTLSIKFISYFFISALSQLLLKLALFYRKNTVHY